MNVQKFAPVYRNTVGPIMGETVLVEAMKKFKDVGITDHSLVWNTDLIETLELENHINLAEHVRYSAVTLAEHLPGSSETAKISADVGAIKEPVDCRLPLMWMSLRSLLSVVHPFVAISAPQHWGHC